MKQILLLRHAKSSWDEPGLKDFDRPLAERGQKDAPRMGRFMKRIGYRPEQVISSTARRAVETTQLVAGGAGIDEEAVIWTDKLYEGTYKEYFEAVRNSPDRSDLVMLVGHNPKMEDMAGLLCGDASIRMPTAALVCFELPTRNWDRVRPGTARLKWMMIPKVLKKVI